MTAIIFGANGQDGFYLSELLQLHGCKVIGISRQGDFLRTDITDYTAVKTLIKGEQPQYIFHLAANSTAAHDALFENHATISTGTFNILEAVKECSPASKVFISGSALQFVNKGIPVKETDPFEARDPYSVSRIQSVYAARYYRRLGVRAYVGYFFNHDSPRRSERHIAMKIAAAARRIDKGSVEKLAIGDSTVIKEWTYAGDIVKALWMFIRQEAIFESNLGSGLGYSIEEWLDACFKYIGKDWRTYVTFNNNFVPDYKKLVSDTSLLSSLGWSPEVSFEELAKMMVAAS